ncbi:MAG: methyltransferase domain-containing protein [Candidatus Bathyarchaeota archaeon]|nr:methyltransferase domain-containing protein [Candidatus Bathyarchaeota archaeon]
MSRHEKGWDRIYHRYSPESLPWELGKPRNILVEVVESGQVAPGRALDACCGAGSNPIFLAKKGFHVTALDISDKAVEFARKKAHAIGADMDLLVGNFLKLPFGSGTFDFIFDFGCFHHVQVGDRTIFIEGVHRVLKLGATYLLVCFSDKNGPAWNHFSREKIAELFQDRFRIRWIRHTSSLEADNVTRYFYEVFMERKPTLA